MTDNLTQWYLIRNEIDPKIIGKVEATQSLKMTEGYDYGDQNSVWNIGTKGFTDSSFSKVNFDKIKLEPGAIYTDLISSMVINSHSVLIISDFLWKCLNEFRLPPTFLQEVNVNHPRLDIDKKYNALYLNDQYDNIDFKKSNFLIKDNNEYFIPWEAANNVKFKDKSNLESFWEKHTWKVSMKAGTLKLKGDFDLFRLHMFGGFFISEKLKKEIEHQNLTGISFEPAENVFVGY